MNLLRLSRLVLAIALVLAVPFEQAVCACPTAAPSAAPARAAARDGHARCCDAPTSRHDGCPAKSARGCTCDHLAAAEPSTTAIVSSAERVSAGAPLLPVPAAIAPDLRPSPAPVVADVGSPPPRIEHGTHGLRAPPALL